MEKAKMCPFKFNLKDLDQYCEKENCALWESYTSQCGILTMSYFAVKEEQFRKWQEELHRQKTGRE